MTLRNHFSGANGIPQKRFSFFLNRVQFETRSASLPKPPMGEDLKRNLRVSNWTRFRRGRIIR
jgi:hypothetical protein